MMPNMTVRYPYCQLTVVLTDSEIWNGKCEGGDVARHHISESRFSSLDVATRAVR